MTDSSPGPGWWLASDGNWYPAHLHPDVRAQVTRPTTAANTSTENDLAHRSPGADTVGRAAQTDAEILAAFHIDTYADSVRTRPVANPLDEIRATTGGGIDWEAVARDRAAQRAARNRTPPVSRPKVLAIAVGVVALVAIVMIARNGGGDGRSIAPITPRTSVAVVTTATAPATSTTTASSTTLAVGTSTASVATTKPPASTLTTATSPTATSGAAANVSVFALTPGSCIDQDDLTTGLVTTVRSVPCTQPHTHEVYFKTSVTPADAAYDAAKVTAFANQACTEGFKAYVGIAYEQSKYYFLHLAPSAESWSKNRDRDVVCLLLLQGQKLTTSVKGKGE